MGPRIPTICIFYDAENMIHWLSNSREDKAVNDSVSLVHRGVQSTGANIEIINVAKFEFKALDVINTAHGFSLFLFALLIAKEI